MKVKVPKKIKIASHTYTIRQNSFKTAEHGTVGTATHMRQKIYIDENLPLSAKNQTLLHEVMHLVDRFWVVKLEESDIDRIAEEMNFIKNHNGSSKSTNNRT